MGSIGALCAVEPFDAFTAFPSDEMRKRKERIMVAMPKEVQEAFAKVPAVALGTAGKGGQPNINVIAIKKLLDESTLYLSDQFFKKTLANLQENTQVSVAFWGEGFAYQVHGTAEYINEGEQFAELQAWGRSLFEAMGLPFSPKGGCIVHVEEVYDMNGGPTAGAQIA